MTGLNGTFASPLADSGFAAANSHTGVLKQVLEGVNGWSIAITTFLLLVAYDQGKYMERDRGSFMARVSQS